MSGNERFKQTEALFHRVVDLSPAEREAVLDQSCRDDPALRQEVQRLLDSHVETGLTEGLRTALSPGPTTLPGDLVGQRLNHYEIVALLGTGGMGEVYVAKDTRLLRRVAVKLLPADVTADPARRERFHREARAVAALNHPGIVTIHSVEQSDSSTGSVHFITMELVDGKTLREFVPDRGMKLHDFFDLAAAITAALAAAHHRGIVHRDLKPENIMVVGASAVKILDFGIAKLFDEPDRTIADSDGTLTAAVTLEGRVVGTPPYMAPEQFTGARIDPRTDIFALGVIFHELLSGERPFQGDTIARLSAAILSGKRRCLTEPRPDVPSGLDHVVGRCLEVDAEKRYQTVDELSRALAAARRSGAVEGTELPTLLGGSVAVVEFTNLTRDPSADWLSTAIIETVTADLKKIDGLSVVSRERILQARDRLESTDEEEGRLLELGRGLDCTWVLAGAFQKVGDAIRITARFVDVSRRAVAESLKIDGKMEEIFALQDRIVDGLTERMELSSDRSSAPSTRLADTSELEAFEYYAKGRQLIHKMDKASLGEARRFLELAVERNPDLAVAHAGLGELHCMRFIVTTNPEELRVAETHLERAIELDPELSEPYVWLAYALSRMGRNQKAVNAGRRAAELDPGSTYPRYMLGVACWLQAAQEYRLERWPEAAAELREVTRLAPRYQPGHQLLGNVYLFHGQYEDAERPLLRATEIEESGDYELARFVGATVLLGKLRFRTGDLDKADEYLRRSLEIMKKIDHVYTASCTALAHWNHGEIALRRRDYGDALAAYGHARRCVDESPRALGMGSILVRVCVGLATAYHGVGMTPEEREAGAFATELSEERREYDFNGIWEGSDAEIHHDFARYHALGGRADEALDSLRRSLDCGWSDSRALDAEPAFDLIRETERFRELRDMARHRTVDV